MIDCQSRAQARDWQSIIGFFTFHKGIRDTSSNVYKHIMLALNM